jgi:hypothetical protein
MYNSFRILSPFSHFSLALVVEMSNLWHVRKGLPDAVNAAHLSTLLIRGKTEARLMKYESFVADPKAP